MKRRAFIQHAMAGAGALCVAQPRVFAAPQNYNGRFFITLQAEGAWDVSSFCDPKANVPGEREINHWSRTKEIETAGNIAYAPFANNRAFFSKYYRDMLVINGIDSQTNSHTTGVLHNWSGRNSTGYPTLTALFAAQNAPELPLSYLNFGGYAETARIIRYTRIDESNALAGVLTPNVAPVDYEEDEENITAPVRYRHESSLLSRIKSRQQLRLDRLRNSSGLLPRKKYAMDAYYEARNNASGLESLAQNLPNQPISEDYEEGNSLRSQIQTALLACRHGAACSADLWFGDFDTHENHDQLHEPLMGQLTDMIDYLWTYAEQLGIADRITLLINSDFSRTPWYNSSLGKDHWAIGSAVVMEKGAAWGNRVVGLTDGGQNAYKIDPTTLERSSSSSATYIYPKHVHTAIRNYLGIDSGPHASSFPFVGTELMPIFSA